MTTEPTKAGPMDSTESGAPDTPNKGSGLFLIIAIVIFLILVIIGVVVYFFINSQKKDKSQSSQLLWRLL